MTTRRENVRIAELELRVEILVKVIDEFMTNIRAGFPLEHGILEWQIPIGKFAQNELQNFDVLITALEEIAEFDCTAHDSDPCDKSIAKKALNDFEAGGSG